jgi:hypothetical protein
MRDRSEINDRLRERNPYDDRQGMVKDACDTLEQSARAVLAEIEASKQQILDQVSIESPMPDTTTVPKQPGYNEQSSALATWTAADETDFVATARLQVESAFKKAAEHD